MTNQKILLHWFIHPTKYPKRNSYSTMYSEKWHSATNMKRYFYSQALIWTSSTLTKWCYFIIVIYYNFVHLYFHFHKNIFGPQFFFLSFFFFLRLRTIQKSTFLVIYLFYYACGICHEEYLFTITIRKLLHKKLFYSRKWGYILPIFEYGGR